MLAPSTLQHVMSGLLVAQAIEQELVWQRLRQLQAEGATAVATVESARPAGLICKVFDALTGFIPGSHVLEVGVLHISASAVCMLSACAAPLSHLWAKLKGCVTSYLRL